MGTYVNNNQVVLGASYDYDDAVKEIASLINVGTRSDGMYHQSDLCVGANINKWSKHKPVRSSDEVNKGTTYIADGWCGFDVSAALVSNRGDISSIASKMTSDGMNGWVYVKPRGNAVSPTEWNRLRDFDNYKHDAIPFIRNLNVPSKWATQGGENFSVSSMYFASMDFLNLTQFDLPIKDYYFGIALISENKTFRMTNTDTIANAGFALTFDTSRLTKGVYNVYAFAAGKVLSITDGDLIPCNIYTLPNVPAMTIEIVESYVIVTVSGEFQIGGGLNYTSVVQNTSGSSRTFNNNYLKLQYASSGWNDPLKTGEYQMTLENFTLAAGASKTFSGTIRSNQYALDMPGNAKLRVSYMSGSHTAETTPRAPANN